MESYGNESSPPSLLFTKAASTDVILRSKVRGDSDYRFTLKADGTMMWGSGSATPTVTLEHKSTTSTGATGGPYENLRFTLPATPQTYQDFLSFWDAGATSPSIRITQKGDLWVHGNKVLVFSGPGTPNTSGGHILAMGGMTYTNAFVFNLATIDGWEFQHDNSTFNAVVQAMRIPNYQDQSSVFINGQLILGNQIAAGKLWTTFTLTAKAHTTVPTTQENNDVFFDLTRTVQWATGAIPQQRFFLIGAPTMAFVGASTCTIAATVSISGAPVAGTNATITDAVALQINNSGPLVQDGILLNRAGDTSNNWIAWTQGDTKKDWRMGMTLGGGTYNFVIYNPNGVVSSPGSPGTAAFTITPAGVVTLLSNLIWSADGGGSIGTSGSNRPSNIFFSSQILAPDGNAGTPGYGFANDTSTNTGMYRISENIIGFSGNGNVVMAADGNNGRVIISGALPLCWGSSGVATPDTFILRVAANVAGMQNGTTAQEWRVYGTTTGPKYASMSHDGTNAFFTQSGGNQIAFATGSKGTTDTTGYVCIPSCAGAPTGVPANIPSGSIPVVFDRTNNFLYEYNSGWKKSTVYA